LIAGNACWRRTNSIGRTKAAPGSPHKRADLIVLTADPTQDTSNLRKLSMTILNGEIVVDKC
jgi:hypothetical protein